MITIEGGRIVPSVKWAPAQDRIPNMSTIRRQDRSPNPNAGTPASLSIPRELTYLKSSKQWSRPANVTGLRFENVGVVTKEGDIRHHEVPWWTVLELAENIDEIFAKLAITKIDITPKLKVETNALDNVTKGMIVETKLNIKRAREELVLALHNQWPPRETQSLIDWLTASK